MESEKERLLRKVSVLVSRLERLSADSIWAHRASGLRGSLLRCLGEHGDMTDEETIERLEDLTARGYEMLNNAAREIPDTD